MKKAALVLAVFGLFHSALPLTGAIVRYERDGVKSQLTLTLAMLAVLMLAQAVNVLRLRGALSHIVPSVMTKMNLASIALVAGGFALQFWLIGAAIPLNIVIPGVIVFWLLPLAVNALYFHRVAAGSEPPYSVASPT